MDLSDFRRSTNVDDETNAIPFFSPIQQFAANLKQARPNPLPPMTNDPLSSAAGYNDVNKSDPLDFTAKYNTPLSSLDEARFRGWINGQSRALGRNVGNDLYDYDLRGWWAANGGTGDNLSGPSLTGAHLTDQFKKPNHPTFSDESQYNGIDGMRGGHWDRQPDNSYAFTPGSTSMFSTPELQDYFKKVEPGNVLNIPST